MHVGGRNPAATETSWADFAQRATDAILVPAVVLMARIFLGSWWPAWAVAILAVLAARRELTRLYFGVTGDIPVTR